MRFLEVAFYRRTKTPTDLRSTYPLPSFFWPKKRGREEEEKMESPAAAIIGHSEEEKSATPAKNGKKQDGDLLHFFFCYTAKLSYSEQLFIKLRSLHFRGL